MVNNCLFNCSIISRNYGRLGMAAAMHTCDLISPPVGSFTFLFKLWLLYVQIIINDMKSFGTAWLSFRNIRKNL